MRLDVYLFENGLAKSRSYARELIENGLVTAGGVKITKPSYSVTDETVEVTGELYKFVGRGGVKLDYALDRFSVDVSSKVAVDVGASTGGFTDCLLTRGAAKVYAVDSGHGQLAKTLLDDSRVVNIEGFNARELSPSVIPEKCDVAVCDVSFISQTLLIPAIVSVLSGNADFVTLIKPQFECGRAALGKGGIVENKKYYSEAVMKVAETASYHGLWLIALSVSPVKGGDGNTEFLAHFRLDAPCAINSEYIMEVTSCTKM